MGGGGTVWDGMAYDPEADLVYVGTGNAGPWPEELRKSKGKDNLYVASVLAVKPDTGELKWYFQMVPGDSWDYDSVQQLLLADLTIKGRQRKVIMQANKNGFYYVLDRVTGQFISGQPFAQVTWAKGLNEDRAARSSIRKRTMTPKPSRSLPGRAARTTGRRCRSIRRPAWSTFPPLPARVSRTLCNRTSTTSRGSRIWVSCSAASAEYRLRTLLRSLGPRLPRSAPSGNDGQRGGALVAWDPVTQTERWRAQGGGSIGGGTVTTAGNLVFQVSPDGRLMAYSADKGEKLLEVQTSLAAAWGRRSPTWWTASSTFR